MNRTTLLLLMALGSSTLFAQEKSSSELKLTKTESNGINVYEAPGNKNPEVVSVIIPAERTLNDWDLEECENALYHVDLKIENLNESASEVEMEQLNIYKTQRTAIIARIELLSNTTK